MASTATITGKVGPGFTATAVVLNNVTDLDFQIGGPTPSPLKSVLRVVSDTGISYYDYSADSTITATLAAGVITITVS